MEESGEQVVEVKPVRWRVVCESVSVGWFWEGR